MKPVGFIRRYKMRKMNEQLEDIFLHDGAIYYDDDNYRKLIQSDDDIDTLVALQDAECCEIRWHRRTTIERVVRGKKTYIYIVERDELWLNRIVSFIAGIASTFIAEWFIQSLL